MFTSFISNHFFGRYNIWRSFFVNFLLSILVMLLAVEPFLILISVALEYFDSEIFSENVEILLALSAMFVSIIIYYWGIIGVIKSSINAVLHSINNWNFIPSIYNLVLGSAFTYLGAVIFLAPISILYLFMAEMEIISSQGVIYETNEIFYTWIESRLMELSGEIDKVFEWYYETFEADNS